MPVKVHLENAGSIVSAEGDVEFVKEVVDEWKHLLEGAGPPPNHQSKAEDQRPGSQKTCAGQAGSTPDEQYENVFALHNDQLKVIADIPGNSKAEVTRSATLLLLYGEYVRGNESVSTERIKAVCVDHGSYDPKNFAAHLKSLKTKVVMDPKQGGDYTVKLTAPGRKFAKEIVEKLNEQD